MIYCQATGNGPAIGMGISPVPGDDSIISSPPYPLAPTPYPLALTPYPLALTPYPLAPTPYPLAPPNNFCHIPWL